MNKFNKIKEIEYISKKKTHTDVSFQGKENNICVVDIETTGLKAYEGARILQISAYKVDTNELFNEYVKVPLEEIPDGCGDFSHIDKQEYIRVAKDLDVVLKDLEVFTKGTILLGHNIESFDLPGLDYVGFNGTETFEYIDTLKMSRSCNTFKRNTLDFLIEEFNLGGRYGDTHNSANDVRYEADLYLCLKTVVDDIGESTVIEF